ncbi:MAG: MOSC domain-containing protein [Marinomonas colpomeniae]
MSYILSELSIYPIKSIKGIPLKSSQVDHAGLWGDRRYMLVKPDGSFITGREHPTLTLINATLIEESKWQLSHPDMDNQITINPHNFSNNHQEVMIWDDRLEVQLAKEDINAWFGQLLKQPINLVHFTNQSKRYTSRRPESPVAFADGYPFLLTTESSLAELNRTCPETNVMAQFRPNLVVQGNNAFEEDTWKRIKIGEVEFENVKPCERCIFITIKPDTVERMKKGEPLKTLGKFRLLGKEGITFGINLIALNTGVINLDDKVEVLEYQESYSYLDRR